MKSVCCFGVALFCLVAAAAPVRAEVVAQEVEYRHDGDILRGYLAYDDTVEGTRPGIVVVHDWMGPGEYSDLRVRMLAELGYVAFAVDMYGLGNYPADPGEAGKIAGMFKNHRDLMRERAEAGYEILKSHPLTDPASTGAMGYCFGGTVALEMGRAGLPLKGIVTFHGGLDNPDPGAAANIRGKVLVLHGADDPHVPPEEVQAFRNEMDAAGADYEFIAYEGAVHAFTQKEAGHEPSKGVAYNAEADRASWERMRDFWKEVFKE